MRFSAIAPLLFTIAAFVLAMLCLFAGSKQGFMEDYDIVHLNVSTLGYAQPEQPDPSQTATPTGDEEEPEETGGFRNWLTGKVSNISDSVEETFDGFLDDVQNGVADRLAEELGIEQWYSLHLMNMCYGSFSPNATSPGAKRNISDCTPRRATYKFDPTSDLEKKLADGPLGLEVTLEDLGWPEEIQDGIDGLNALTTATFVFYCIGIGFAGILILTSIAAIFATGRLLSIVNMVMAVLAFLCLGIASAVLTAFMVKTTDLINDKGNDVGVYAGRGNKFLTITWVATGLMLLATIAWIVFFIMGRKHSRRRGSGEKNGVVHG